MPSFRHIATRRLTLLITFALLALVLQACTNKGSDKSLQNVSLSEGQKLAAGERGLLGKNKSGAWVDARTKADYDAGHIPGAISLPFEKVSTDFDIVKSYSVIIIYGAEYNDARAKSMAKRLRELLPDADIRWFDGGVRAWTAAGNPLDPPQSDKDAASKSAG